MKVESHKSNSKIFFILIPIFIVVLSFLFDIGSQIVQDKRLEIVTKDIIKDSLTTNVNDYYKKAKEIYEDKKIKTELLEVIYENNTLIIRNSHSYPTLFGRIFGVNTYRSSVAIKGIKNNDEIIFEEANYE